MIIVLIVESSYDYRPDHNKLFNISCYKFYDCQKPLLLSLTFITAHCSVTVMFTSMLFEVIINI